ncbi:U3 snoRNP protein [Conoideocrella luteorostrata]|uniref:U3 small nucleolar ribonucleoprotein protein MPP10 n=1 Tax=Conoideocrella luteorostrata TaxID=1105319 RepID=A0AAJ0CMV4_9HYPO|nr:U3 snoRNP protein [Conoideocrella luteorostrata]
MAVATSPTLTSTSHTLTGQPVMAPASATGANPTSVADMVTFLANLHPENRHIFIEPDISLPSESLNIVKDTLEAFAAQVGDLQQARLKESRKRKRSAEKGVASGDVLKLRKVYVDGFETGQVWQQAKRIIGGVLGFAEGLVEELQEDGEIVEDARSKEGGGPRTLSFGKDGFEVGSDEDEASEGGLNRELNEDDDDDDDEDEEDEEEEDEEEETDLENGVDGVDYEDEELQDAEGQLHEDDDDDDKVEEEEEEEEDADEYVEDPNGLNDGFFSIDAFNKQTQWFEDQDARGDLTTDQASDDEDVDWGADPLAPSKSQSKSSAKKPIQAPVDEEEDDEEEEEDGPTFGDMALDAPEGDSEDEAMDLEDGADKEDDDFNANEVYYKDFFAAPARKNRPGKPFKKKAVHFEPQKPNEEDTERAMADVKRDLFDDESENEDSDDALSDVSAGDPKSRRSTHERRQAKLAEEIRQLEAASVAKREWTLSGEATAVDRPMNSLLEQDLDFEHVGKPVPVITPEVSESIEELIKRRILSQEFDEVLRRRPDTDVLPANARRGLVEVDDSKSTKGLAEVYEEEHIKNANPDTYVSKADEKVQKEEKEIEAMWRDVSARLDALSSWHYKPKPTAPSLTVVSDVATISMEDAQPSTAQAIAGESSRMAPQEIYKAGADKDSVAKGEVVTKAGMPLSREEISREDRTRRRRRHKERMRKAGGADAQRDKKLGSRAKMQRDTMAELKKGGVRVINRKGEITDVDGNKAKTKKVASSGSFKL